MARSLIGRRAAAWAHVLAAALRRSSGDPRWAGAALMHAWRLLRRSGWRGLSDHAINDFLPRHFRLRTRLRLGGPSPAVHRKFDGVLRRPPAPVDAIAMPWGRLREPARILVIRSGAMGDVLMATPIVRKLFQDRLGHARIDVATRSPDVFRSSPYVHRTVDLSDLARSPQQYDLVLDLDGAYERNPACHAVDAYAFCAFGRTDFDRSLDLFPTPADRLRIAGVVAELGQPYLVVHKPQHHWPNRNLPLSLWRALLDGILAAWPHPVVQVGGPGDLALDGDPRLLDHRQRYSLQELHLLIAGSAAFVGVDAGPMHVAATTAAPMCVFFTSAHHDVRKPLRAGGTFVPIVPDIDCYGCQATNPPPGTGYHCRRGDNACVDRFDADRAVAAILAAAAFTAA